METQFDVLINSYIDNKVGIAENFLETFLAAALKENLLTLFEKKQLYPAGVGNNAKLLFNNKLRSDVIYWLDRSHNNSIENDFFDMMDRFVLYLNETCYAGIQSYEFHYALYDEGSFYKRHLDQFKDDKNRQFSMIMYLNTDWQEGDGGELCIYDNDKDGLERTQKTSPSNQKCVFFKSSDLEHEVLLSHKPRLSVTGWLKR